jgi:hypothetical protein
VADQQPSARPIRPAGKLLGLLVYVLAVMLLLLAITGAGAAIVRVVRAVI